MKILLRKKAGVYYLHIGLFGKEIIVNDISFLGVWGRFFIEALKRLTFHSPIPKYIDMIEFRNHRRYWIRRGGDQYFREQEARQDREARSHFIADEISALSPSSVLEVGCGYGKQLKNIRERIGAKLFGIDFSTTQISKAQELSKGKKEFRFVVGDGSKLPFKDNSFDLSFTSAVILHNKPTVAQAMRKELVRVTRRWIVHNEDISVSYSRYGYDNKQIYEDMGYEVVKSVKIPVAKNPVATQFTIIRLDKKQKQI